MKWLKLIPCPKAKSAELVEREKNGAVHSESQQQDILFELRNTISSNKKGDPRNNLLQKRHRDIDCHSGSVPRQQEKRVQQSQST